MMDPFDGSVCISTVFSAVSLQTPSGPDPEPELTTAAVAAADNQAARRLQPLRVTVVNMTFEPKSK